MNEWDLNLNKKEEEESITIKFCDPSQIKKSKEKTE